MRLQREPGLVFFVNRLDLDFGGVGQKRADDQARTIAQRVHAQQGVRRRVFQFHQTAQFIGRENHAGKA